jgi:hypothetical protein
MATQHPARGRRVIADGDEVLAASGSLLLDARVPDRR